MKKNSFLSIIRHLLSIGGGMVIANNPGHADNVQTTVGVITALAGLAWGAIDEHRAEKDKTP
jgi:hypothetical protein